MNMIYINARFLTQEISGVQRFSIEICRELKQRGLNFVLISPSNIIHHELAKELKVRIIGSHSGHLWEQIDLPKFLKKNNSPLLLNLANTAPLFYNNKITAVHDIAFVRFPQTFNWKFRLFYKLLIPRILNNSKHIITVSEFSKKEIIDYYGIDSEKISAVYNAVGVIFEKKSKEYEDKYILAVSSLNYQKNFSALIGAFNLLKNNDQLKLYLVGAINKNFDNPVLLNNIKNNRNIIFKGRVSDEELVRLYSNAQCFVYPSLYEGFGIPPLEAQACGCPCIVSNVASLPEACAESVLYCDPSNINDIAVKINTMISDNNFRLKIIRKGYKNIKRFSWEESAMKIINIIENQR